MATYEITYVRGSTETVDAGSYESSGAWFLFYKRTKPLDDLEERPFLRIKASSIQRIEVMP